VARTPDGPDPQPRQQRGYNADENGHRDPAARGLRAGEPARERQGEHREQRCEQAVPLEPALTHHDRISGQAGLTLRFGAHGKIVAPGIPRGRPADHTHF
jgi:hypothetical protein